MRWQLVLAAATLATAGLAGCLGNDAQSNSADENPQPEPQPEEQEFVFPTNDTFCDTNCDFDDDLYHEYVLYEVDTTVIDILVIPGQGVGWDGATMGASAQAWADGIQELGAPWLTNNMTINVYVIGEDVPPTEAIEDPEIIVVGAEYNPALLFGIGLQVPYGPCRESGEFENGTSLPYNPLTDNVVPAPDHAHHGMAIYREQCKDGGYTCLALNTNFLAGGTQRMFDLVSHEIGHCLGPGHVGDALDFKSKRVPQEDIMSYQFNPDQVHCVSSLNVRVIEGIYAPLLDQPEDIWLEPGTFYDYDPALYTQVECANP